MFKKSKNKVPHIKGIVDVQQVFFGDEDFKKEKSIKKSVEKEDKPRYTQSVLDVGDYKEPKVKFFTKNTNKYYIDENLVIGELDPFCPKCNRNRVIKWNIYSKNVNSKDYSGEINIQRYKCKICGITFNTKFEDQFKNHSSFSKDLLNLAASVKELNWSSYRDIAAYFEIFLGIEISHETIRKELEVIQGNEIVYNIPELSGYYGYDAQWVKINSKWKFRHALYDLVNRMPVAELFADEEKNSDVYDFINRNVDIKFRKGIVTDMKKGYDVVMAKLKFDAHQYCIFHFKLGIKRLIRNHINTLKQEKTIELKQVYKNASDEFIEEKVSELIEEEETEIKYSLYLLYYLFQERTHDKAMSYIELLKSNSVNFPPFIKKYLDDEFFLCYYKFIHHLEKDHINKLDRTNNKTEGYFRGTMPKGQKRKFKTLKGIINQVYYQGRGWIKNSIKSKEIRSKKRKKLIENEKNKINEMGLNMNFKKRF